MGIGDWFSSLSWPTTEEATNYFTPPQAEAPAAASPNPYDPLDFLRDMAVESSRRIDGLTAERSRLDKEREGLNTYAEGNWGQLGAAAIGALGGYLGGGTPGQVATAASTVGTSYYNNLEAQEKQKQAAVLQNLNFTESQLKDEMNNRQTLQAGSANLLGGLSKDWLQGNEVSRDPNSPFQIKSAQRIKESQEIYGARPTTGNRIIDSTVAQAAFENAGLGNRYNPNQIYTQADIDQLTKSGNLAARNDTNARMRAQMQQAAASLMSGNWEVKPGKATNPVAAKMFVPMNLGYEIIKKQTPILISLLQKGSQATDGDKEAVRSALGEIQPFLGQFHQGGKALTDNEIRLGIFEEIPALPLNDASTWRSIGWQKFMGLDPVRQLQQTLKSLDVSMNAAADVVNWQRPNPASPGTRIAGLDVDESGQLVFGAQPSAAASQGGALPPNEWLKQYRARNPKK